MNGWMARCLRWREAWALGLFVALLAPLQATAEVRLLQESATGVDQETSDAILSMWPVVPQTIFGDPVMRANLPPSIELLSKT